MNEVTIVESGLKFKFKLDQNGMMKCHSDYPMLPPALVSRWRAKAANEAEWCFNHQQNEYIM